jgi:hypothetical protein
VVSPLEEHAISCSIKTKAATDFAHPSRAISRPLAQSLRMRSPTEIAPSCTTRA